MKTQLTLTALSSNEFTLMNNYDVQVLLMPHNEFFTIPAGKTIFVEDKLQYRLLVQENEFYVGSSHSFVVPTTIRAPDDEGRVVINYTAQLEATRAGHVARVNELAEEARGRFITLGSGQAMTYDRKLLEAQQLLASENPEEFDLSTIPHIAGEAADEGMTPVEKAQQVAGMGQFWVLPSSLIERRRMATNRALAAAQTLEDMDAVMVQLTFSDITV